MKRVLALALVSLMALALPAGVRAGVSLDIGVHVGSPPPAPVFVFEDEPAVVLIPETRVYYVPGPQFDLFRYGRFWYINNGGWWYRSYNYRGPFNYIEYEKVPVTILRVPRKYHRHPLGGPPGLRGDQPDRGGGRVWERDRGRDREDRGERVRRDRGRDRDDRGDREDRGDRGRGNKKKWDRDRGR